MGKLVSELDLLDMMPEAGDKVIIVNTGYSFEVYTVEFVDPPLVITPEEVEMLMRGEITFQ